ncbi:hypothetical protein CYMTET_6730 [Cymbomonas tetramitiformis]|uniref:Uncharacterized protein n=1 Tax=Cymbomonas tetramitiformis TaxID=36881 RepID=A0AAE0GWH8_9CHLO|nr:hypothetical protein CYMTET_6730 [Cymbomonas tetramitiformis]
MTTTPTMTIAARVGAGGTETKTEKLEETEEPEEPEETEEPEEPEKTAIANACNSFGWDETATPKTKQFIAEDLHELKTSLSNTLEEDIPPIADFESGVKRVKATHPPTAKPTVDDEANDGEDATSDITSVVESESESDTTDD